MIDGLLGEFKDPFELTVQFVDHVVLEVVDILQIVHLIIVLSFEAFLVVEADRFPNGLHLLLVEIFKIVTELLDCFLLSPLQVYEVYDFLFWLQFPKSLHECILMRQITITLADSLKLQSLTLIILKYLYVAAQLQV